MKQKLLHFFAVFVALVMAIPIAKSDVTISEPSLVWKTELAPASDAIMAAHSDIYGQGAASDGIIFTLPGSSTVSNYPDNMTQGYLFGKDLQSIWSGGNLASAFPYETSGSYYYLGPCIASDDAGTLWCASRRSANPVHDGTNALVPWAVGARALTYYIERPAKGVAGKRFGIDLRTPSLHTSGRADIMSVYGDGVNGTGYFWFNIGSTTTIECIMIKDASTTNGKKMTFTAPIASSTNRGYVKQFAATRVLYNAGKAGTGTSTLYVGTLNASTPEESTSITWESTGLTVCRHGSTAFMLAGHEMIAYSKSTTQIALYDNTDKKEIGTIAPFSTVSNISAVSHSLDAKKVDDNNVDLYVYVPGQGGAKYTITATPTHTDPVTNMQVQTGIGMPYSAIVNWNAPSGEGTPSKYAVSYSTDGGSSWSTAVETTSLSYTYSGLTQGEYIFKVTPYYGSVAGEATTKSATVYGVTTPVSTVNVAYYNNTGNSVAVTWTAPETGDVAPDKYQVCYSSDGGSSWSTAVETTELTYTFSNLPLGTYTFKVTPIYNGVAGDAALSENINTLAPTGYNFIVTKKWEVSGTLNKDGDVTIPAGKSIAVSNDVLYVSAMDQYGTISYVNKDKYPTWPNFNSGYNKTNFGYGMDNDDAGNIIVKSGSYLSNAATQLTVYPAGATSADDKKEFTLGDAHLPGGRADYIGAQGDIYNGTGYLWFAPQNTKTIKRIKIENKSGVPTSTEMITWTHAFDKDNYSEVIVRPLEDGRLYYHYHQGVCKIITLPEGGGEIPSANVETISLTTNQTNNFSSDAIILKGNLLNIRNAGVAAQDISFEVYNTTAKSYATYNGEQVITPFDGVRSTGETNALSGLSLYTSIIRAIKVDDNTVDVYVYSLYHGASCYRIGANPVYTVTGAIQSLDYEYTTVETEEGTRQDVVLTWTAPEVATPTSYKVYRDETLVATVAAPALTYTDKNVNANHTYTVVPYFAGVTEDESLGLSVTTTEVETVLWAPIITEIRSYDGYSIAQLFFKMPSLSKVASKHYSFNVYRDGILLESGITQLNFIDDNLPKIEKQVEESHNYVYTVEAVYSDTYNNAKRMSEGKTVTVTYRDWSLAGYILQDVYNVPINQALGSMPTYFTNHDYYRQGQFYNGSWYIAERSDALCQKDQDKANGIDDSVRDDMKSDDANATGGVIVFNATNEIDVREGMKGKIITNDAFENLGIAMDDKGTIFVRNNNITKLAATTPSDGNPSSVAGLHDGFGRRITEGALYTRNDDGTYSTTPTIVDLQALWLDNRWIDDMVFTSGKSYGQVAGRSDYYHMYGDVMSAEGGYLILSPSWTRTIFKVKIVNGAYDSHEVMEFPSSYTEENQYTGKTETHTIATGSENYGFKIAGREAWMAQIRSNGYFGIHGVEEGHEGEEHEHEWHAIFNTDSRINNSGGTSIVAFDNPLTTEVNDGETFLITPACMYSRNQGDFIVTRGIKGAIDEDVADSKLSPPMPVAQYKQETQNTNVATNANGNWFHAETGTYESVSGEDEECVYIYQYVPGVRFAKYRLVPDNQLPVVYPTLTLATAYNEDKTDITHFNGVSTWERPSGFGEANPENSRVWIDSYTYQLLDPNGKKIYETEVPEQYNADGTPVKEYSITTDVMSEKTDSIAFNNYTARVAVNYKFATGSSQQSVFNLAIDNNDYVKKPATETYVQVFKGDDMKFTNEDNTTSVLDVYRVELDFMPPVWEGADEGKDEPVSYYTIQAVVNKKGEYKGDTIPVENFQLYQGSEINNGKIWGVSETTSQIPGTYDFTGSSKAPYYTTITDAETGTGLYNGTVDGGSNRKVVLSFFHSVPAGTYDEEDEGEAIALASEGEEVVITNDPSEWEFIITAHYAARNTYIAKEAGVGVSPNGLLPTGVEIVGDDNVSSLQIYPIPASTSITIKSPVAINDIVIYNEVGAEVMNANGVGENIVELNIESLATGYYFVKVNNNAPVKIIKK